MAGVARYHRVGGWRVPRHYDILVYILNQIQRFTFPQASAALATLTAQVTHHILWTHSVLTSGPNTL